MPWRLDSTSSRLPDGVRSSPAAATGIGAAIAEGFAACGADVAVTAHARDGEATLSAIRREGRRAEAIEADLAPAYGRRR